MSTRIRSRPTQGKARPDMKQDLDLLLTDYLRKGGKDNRKRQRACLYKFIDHCHKLGARSLGQIGRRHVLQFWKSNRGLSDKRLYDYWLALCTFWELTSKIDVPPQAWTKAMLEVRESDQQPW